MKIVQKQNRWELFLWCLVMGIAILLRLWDLNRFSPWFDEALCIFESDSIMPLLTGKGTANNPPVFFILLHIAGIFSRSILSYRMVSVGFGLATIVLVFSLGRIVWNTRIALIAMLLLAMSPMHIYYSQEVKMYSMNGFLFVLALIMTYLLTETPGWSRSLALGVIMALMLYTHYYLFLAVLTINLLLFLTLQQTHRKYIVIVDATTCLLFLPWLPVYHRYHLPATLGYVTRWIPQPGIKHLFYTLKNFIAGFHSIRVLYWPIVTISVFLIVIAGLKAIRQSSAFRKFLFLAAPFPIAIAFLISQQFPLYLDRYFLFILPLLLLLVAAGFDRLPKISSTILLPVILLPAVWSYPALYASRIPFPWHISGEPERLRIREMISVLKTEMTGDDILFHISRRTLLSFEYEWPEKGLQNYWVVSVYEKYPQPTHWTHSSLLAEPIESHLRLGDRFWVVLSNWPDDPQDPLITETRRWLGDRARLIRQIVDFSPAVLEYYEWTDEFADQGVPDSSPMASL
ncbi:glycosyltransferase family 39 protein [bacterium]|nr:glycosyltransferase family 39 protein [candidate division CSSED10-310 bacterium]